MLTKRWDIITPPFSYFSFDSLEKFSQKNKLKSQQNWETQLNKSNHLFFALALTFSLKASSFDFFDLEVEVLRFGCFDSGGILAE